MDILDGIINTILGPDTSQMSEEDRRKTEAGRAKDTAKASEYAFNASNDPGSQFMRPETSVGTGKSIMDSVKTLMQLFGGGGGGG
jgi:hypothetical protein